MFERAKTWAPLIGFLLLYALIAAAFPVMLGLVDTLRHGSSGNEFAGISVIIGIRFAPVVALMSVVPNAFVYRRTTGLSRHVTAAAVSLAVSLGVALLVWIGVLM